MASLKGVIRFSVSLHPSLVRAFDASWKDMGYESRSKAAHDAFRSFISEYKSTREKAGEIAGTITLVYYLDKPGLLNQIVKVQHKFENVVTASMHVHLAKDKCLEIIAVKGKAGDIRSLSQALMTKKGVKQLKFTAIAL
jgi:CopG family nickel-responsive transcriptional regulator